jgi:Glycosyltransferase family 87
MRLPRSPVAPAVAALSAIIAIAFATHFPAIAFPLHENYKPPTVFSKMARTQFDLRMLLGAGGVCCSGVKDYDELRRVAQERDPGKRPYPYPPLACFLFMPLSRISTDHARLLWLFAFPLSFSLCLLCFLRAALPRARRYWPQVLLATVLCFMGSASVLHQLERGNYDWVVLSLYLLALAFMSLRRGWIAGVLLALAIALKAYPLVLLPFLVVLRRWREAAAALLTLAVIILLTGPTNHLQWLNALAAERLQWQGLHPWNTSLANVIVWLDDGLAPIMVERLASVTYLLLSGGMLAIVWRLEVRRRAPDPAQLGALLLPLMFMVPSIAWGYTLFSLIAILPVLVDAYAQSASQRCLLLAMGGLVGICQSALPAFWRQPPRGELVIPVFSLCLVFLTVLSGWALVNGAWGNRATPPRGAEVDVEGEQ